VASQKKNAWSKWQLAFQLVAILVLSALLVGILAAEISRTADALQYEEARVATVPLYMDKVGYVFYDAAIVESIDQGPIDYRVADQALVQAGETLAVVYADGAGAGTRERANEIMQEIARLQAFDSGVTPDYHAAYFALMQKLSACAVQAAAPEINTLTDALSLFAAQGESADARASRIAALYAEFEELIKNDRDASDAVTATAAGLFCRETDGFEENMTLAATDTLTVGALAALLASPQDRSAAIGRVMMTNAWRIAVEVTETEAACLTVGMTYSASFASTDEARTLTLVRVSAPDADGNCLLILAGDGMPPARFERRQQISICYGAREGLSVPMAALTEQNGVCGVFVRENGRASWRAITPVYMENGHCLVVSDGGEGALVKGEWILVTLRRVYEGKAL